MLIRITVRNYTGTSFALDVDTATTVAELKQRIVEVGKGKSVRLPELSFNDHNLRDAKQLCHYDIAARDTIHIRETLLLYLLYFAAVYFLSCQYPRQKKKKFF